MKACHLLLGRPWLYDRGVKYDGYKNTYSFMFGRKKIVLQPLKIHDFEAEPREDKVLTLRYFSIELKESGIVFALVARAEVQPTDVDPRPPEIQALLDDLADLTPTELPQTLPPAKDIQHAIDLFPEATLSNIAAYRMSPAEHKELQLQVQELLDKRFIYESMCSARIAYPQEGWNVADVH